MLHVAKQLEARFPGRRWAGTRALAGVSVLMLLLGVAMRMLG
jgi:hypothetical protein